jgi:hypothetical protein
VNQVNVDEMPEVRSPEITSPEVKSPDMEEVASPALSQRAQTMVRGRSAPVPLNHQHVKDSLSDSA